jgi:pyrroloquinoline quinone biosynthesis protein B
MHILILGSGAGSPDPRLTGHPGPRPPRSHSCIAVSTDGRRWLLVNAPADFAAQWVRHAPPLASRADGHAAGRPAAPPPPLAGLPAPELGGHIAAVLLLSAQLDDVAGLLSLRAGPPVELFATPAVFEDLTAGWPLLPVLEHYGEVRWHVIPVAGGRQEAVVPMESVPGLRVTAVGVPGLPPPWSLRRHEVADGHQLALWIEEPATGQCLFYGPGLAGVGERERELLSRADCVLVDGTFWTDDDWAAAGGTEGPGGGTHLPQSGPGGMLEALALSGAARKVLIHIARDNPILDEASPEHAELRQRGIEVAFDGMRISL